MIRSLIFILLLFICPHVNAQTIQKIEESVLLDKIHGYWIGQLAGNYLGFPFENQYSEEPIPILIDRYYNFGDVDSLDLKMNINDRRGFTHIMAEGLGGSWSDDDTDIEFVTLHGVEQFGLDMNYEEITQLWKKHINRFIWSANRRARDLMDEGFIPPATGSRENNEFWYRITSQLINEIWGAFYPGMTKMAGDRAEWGGRISCDGWALHATRSYAVMYSAAFFENDVKTLVQIASDQLPDDSPFKTGIKNVQKWHKENADWRVTRQLIHDHYFAEVDGFTIPTPVVGSTVNGLCGIMAILYGDGDFEETIAIATSAGYDCDNQAATCGGLLGILNGASAIPDKFTLSLPSRGEWDKPFNDQYINYSRDGLPNFNRISDIVERIRKITEQAIEQEGGSKIEEDNKWIYIVNTDY